MRPYRTARWKRTTLMLALAIIASACGCARWNWRGEGFGNDSEARLARGMRPPADSRKFSGLDARAREIENNLGVR